MTATTKIALAVALALGSASATTSASFCSVSSIAVPDGVTRRRDRRGRGPELPAARIEILDFSRQPAPDGELVFPSAGLRQGPDGGYWSG